MLLLLLLHSQLDACEEPAMYIPAAATPASWFRVTSFPAIMVIGGRIVIICSSRQSVTAVNGASGQTYIINPPKGGGNHKQAKQVPHPAQFSADGQSCVDFILALNVSQSLPPSVLIAS